MKILVYFSGKLMEPKGTPIRTRNLIKQLLKHGIDVYYAGYDQPEGVPADHVLKLAPPANRFGQLVTYVKRQQIDVVYMQTSAGLWFAPAISWFTSAKVGVDFHSRRFQEEHVYKNRSELLTDVLEWVELVFARTLDFSTSVAHTITNYYLPAVQHSLVVPVGVDTKLFSPDITPDSSVVSWKGSSVVMAYAGNTKWYQGVEGVLEAFKRLEHEMPGTFKFLVIASSGIEDVQKYAKENGLESSMLILDKQPHEKIPGLLAAADILTVVRPSDMVTEFSFPSKLPEYAAMGKSLIVSRVSDIETYIKNEENGMVVNPGDAEATYGALKKLANSALREKLGKNARELAVKTFDLNALGDRLVTFLQTLKK